MKFSVGISDQQYVFDLQGFFKDPSELLNLLLLEAVAFSQASFSRQGLYQQGEWMPPPEINIVGIWRDLNTGKNPPSRRIDPNRKALMDTGLLKRSITWRLISETEGEFGSNVSYAADHQFGSEVTLHRMVMRKEIEKKIEAFIKKYKGELNPKQIARIRRLKSISSLRVNIPKRPFLGFPEEEVIDIVMDYLEEKYSVRA